MIRAGIIGCGIIADAHMDILQHMRGVEIVGVCDREGLMAKQLFERYQVRQYYDDVHKFLEESRPEIVHITTPPGSHYALGKLCIDAGCHVYIEKPFTLDSKSTTALIVHAEERNRKITVGHDATFNYAERRMRSLISRGYLGEKPLHMESYYCYDLGDTYAKALASDKDHWVRKLPGKLLHNIISHGICKIAEHLEGGNIEITVQGFTSPALKALGEEELIDELRVIINEDNKVTAYFTFSSQMRPALHQFRVFGSKNGLFVDHNHQTCIKLKGNKYKSYLDVFVPPVEFSKQYFANLGTNLFKFARNDLHMKSGMKYLIESFYKSVENASELPIPYREIILTSQIMESIFNKVYR